MKFRRSLPTLPPLNLTPLIDVILMLLVFFLLATVFRVGPGLAVQLPVSSTAKAVSMTTVRLTVVSESEIWVDGQKVALAGLDGLLKQELAGKDRAHLRVVVEGGYDAPYQLVVSVLDHLRQAGIDGVNLMTRLARRPS